MDFLRAVTQTQQDSHGISLRQSKKKPSQNGRAFDIQPANSLTYLASFAKALPNFLLVRVSAARNPIFRPAGGTTFFLGTFTAFMTNSTDLSAVILQCLQLKANGTAFELPPTRGMHLD